MSRYDQFEEEKSSGLLIGLVVIALAGAGWFFFNRPSEQAITEPQRQELKLPQVADEAPSPEPSTDNLTSDQAASDAVDLDIQALLEQNTPLPELSKSDPGFREAITAVSPGLSPWLKPDHIIPKAVTVANDFSQGLWIEKHMRFLKPSQAFSAERTEKGLFIADKSYHRYDALAAAIDAIDAKSAIAVYKKFRPLLLEAYQEFGYPPERTLEDLFLKSASQILAAPIIAEPIALVRPSVLYKYANDELEKLSPVSKQMLRMGPQNTRTIQNKVRQLVQELINQKDEF